MNSVLIKLFHVGVRKNMNRIIGRKRYYIKNSITKITRKGLKNTTKSVENFELNVRSAIAR